MVYASGVTNIIDIAFGPGNALYVLKLDTKGLVLPGGTGAITRVDACGVKTPVFSGLTAPGGLAFGAGWPHLRQDLHGVRRWWPGGPHHPLTSAC